jgi:hypothetical protein
MRPHLLVGATLALTTLSACASRPDVKQLCGVWDTGDLREHWWIDGKDLRGESHIVKDGVPMRAEVLWLRHGKAGHVYVAQPGDASPTEFTPIDPSRAKYGPESVAAAQHFAWANYEHDFPQEIHYVLLGDRLAATIGGPNGAQGWELERTAACTEAQ